MTKKTHRCDETCKVNHTTDYARKNKLASGSKVVSTKESSDKAYKEQVKRIAKTVSFVKKQKLEEDKPIMSISKVTLPLLDEIEFYVCKIDCELETSKILEKTIINLRKLEKDLG